MEGREYTFYVRTEENCLDTLVIDIPVYGIPELEEIDKQMAFCEEPVGSVTVAGNGGKGMLSYELNGAAQEEQTRYENLSAGSYNILVSDETGCTSVLTIEIESTPRVTIDGLSAEQLFCGDVLSEVSFTPSGGTGNISYELTDATGNLVDKENGLPEGQYSLVLTDELGCELQEFIRPYIESIFSTFQIIIGRTNSSQPTIFSNLIGAFTKRSL